MSNALPELLQWARSGKSWAEAILVKAQHSSPLPPGARLYVNEDGEMRGAISMGCVENDIREHLLNLLRGGEPRLVHYGAGNEFTLEVGLTCGGEIDVLLRVQPNDSVWKALSERTPDEPAILLTRISPPFMGRQRICFSGGSAGTLGDAVLDRQADAEIASLRRRGGCAYLELGAVAVFAENLESPPNLAIVGASPIAVALCRMATMAGFRVILVDPRRGHARTELFPDAVRVIHEWPEEGLKVAGLDDRWYVAVVAHDPKLDMPALTEALKQRCGYIGLLGSRRTQEKYRSQLAERGFAAEETARIHGPIGLRFGALEPVEIAVAILAEMIGHRRNGLT